MLKWGQKPDRIRLGVKEVMGGDIQETERLMAGDGHGLSPG